MENTPDSQKSARAKVSVNELSPLVAHSKSKKLAAIANKSSIISPPTAKSVVFSNLKSEPDSALQQARQLIDARIQEIMSSFPEGKRTKLFSLRFGSVAAIQALDIKTTFKKLAIDSHNLNMRLLASLNYHGDRI